jgi:hypothetical protein
MFHANDLVQTAQVCLHTTSLGGDAELECGAMASNGVEVMGPHGLRPPTHGWDMLAHPLGGWSGVGTRGSFGPSASHL